MTTLAKSVIDYGHFLFRHRNHLFPAVLFVLFVLFPPRQLSGNANLDVWMNIAGILVIITGQAVRAMVIGLVYIKRGGVNKKIYAESLVTDGIFAHCRNPLYAGNLLILAGFFIIHNNPAVYLFGCVFFLFSYHAIVRAEESYLLERFGEEFREYCRNTSRWLINFTGIGKTLASMQFNWRRVLAKDYTTMLTWFLTVIFLITWEYISWYGIDFSRAFIIQMSLPVIIALTFSILVRILKKSGRLAG